MADRPMIQIAKVILTCVILAPIWIELWVRLAYLLYRACYGGRSWENLAHLFHAEYMALKVLDEALTSLGIEMAIKVDSNAAAVHLYTPISERDLPEGEAPTVIKMKRLGPLKVARVRDNMIELGKGGKIKKFRTLSIRTETTILQLAGWENVIDTNTGKPVVYNDDGTNAGKVAMFAILPEDLQGELTAVFGDGGFSQKGEDQLLKAQLGEGEESGEGMFEDDEDEDSEGGLMLVENDDVDEDDAVGL